MCGSSTRGHWRAKHSDEPYSGCPSESSLYKNRFPLTLSSEQSQHSWFLPTSQATLECECSVWSTCQLQCLEGTTINCSSKTTTSWPRGEDLLLWQMLTAWLAYSHLITLSHCSLWYLCSVPVQLSADQLGKPIQAPPTIIITMVSSPSVPQCLPRLHPLGSLSYHQVWYEKFT